MRRWGHYFEKDWKCGCCVHSTGSLGNLLSFFPVNISCTLQCLFRDINFLGYCGLGRLPAIFDTGGQNSTTGTGRVLTDHRQLFRVFHHHREYPAIECSVCLYEPRLYISFSHNRSPVRIDLLEAPSSFCRVRPKGTGNLFLPPSPLANPGQISLT